jgi:hypothetical protein
MSAGVVQIKVVKMLWICSDKCSVSSLGRAQVPSKYNTCCSCDCIVSVTKLLSLDHSFSVSDRWACSRYLVVYVRHEWGLSSVASRVWPYPQDWLGQTSHCLVQRICEAYPVSCCCMFSEIFLEWMLCQYYLFDMCYRLGSQLPTLPRSAEQEPLQPQCDVSLSPLPIIMDRIPDIRFRHQLHLSPEPRAAQWLGVLAGDENSSTQELGTRIALALQEVYADIAMDNAVHFEIGWGSN